MARYTRVYTQFWTDEKVALLTEDARTLLLYLLTCPHSNMLGIFVLPALYACADLKWPRERYDNALAELRRENLVVQDERLQVVWLPNFLKHNPIENPSQAAAAIKVVDELPRTQLLAKVADRVKQCAKDYLEPLVAALLARCPAQCPPQCPPPCPPPCGTQCGTPVTVTVSVPVSEVPPPPPSPTPDGVEEGAGEGSDLEGKPDKPDKREPTLEEIFSRYPRYSSEQWTTIRNYWDLIRFTRKTGRVANSVVAREMDYWERFLPEIVLKALRIHLRKYPEKEEEYTRGIMRRLQRERERGDTRGRTDRRAGAGQSGAVPRAVGAANAYADYDALWKGP